MANPWGSGPLFRAHNMQPSAGHAYTLWPGKQSLGLDTIGSTAKFSGVPAWRPRTQTIPRLCIYIHTYTHALAPTVARAHALTHSQTPAKTKATLWGSNLTSPPIGWCLSCFDRMLCGTDDLPYKHFHSTYSIKKQRPTGQGPALPSPQHAPSC